MTSLADIADDYDAFLLDAFGVLNIGETPIPGAPELVESLQRTGKRVLVLTNGASYPAPVALAKYSRLGFAFAPDDVIASRDALRMALVGRREELWGVMGPPNTDLAELGVSAKRLSDEPRIYAQADGFAFLGSEGWTWDHQERLIDALSKTPRPVLVGNPDIIAPRESGFTLEPGHFAHDIANRLGLTPEFYGKPFRNIYDLALSRLDGVERTRTLMVGDTLHTDVLGGAAAGVHTALVRSFGLFAGQEVVTPIVKSGIVPNYVVENI